MVVEQNKLFAKCARRLIPWMTLFYLINILDRVNVGFAALTMNKDLGFTPAIFGFGAGVFFIGYFAFQIPANIILQHLGARRWISLILGIWGLISAANAFVQGPFSFYALRFLLGLFESGFYPAMLLYLTYWFPQAYRAQFTAQFMIAAPLSLIIGAPVSAMILDMDGIAGLHGWQWLFLIEGLPAALLAFVAFRVLPDNPSDAPWLNSDEKREIANQFAADDRVAHHRELWPALLDPRVLALGLATFGVLMGYYGIGLWLPQIVQAMGFTNIATGFIVGSLFLVSTSVMVFWGRSSDEMQERVWHVVLPSLLASAGFVGASLVRSDLLSLAALSLAAVGLFCIPAPFWSLASSLLRGTAAAGGIAIINAIGSLGGFLGATLVGVLKQETGGYEAGMVVLALGSIVSALIVLIIGRAVSRGKLQLD